MRGRAREEVCTPHPTPYTIYPSYSHNPTPYTNIHNTQLSNLNLQPSTLNPQTSTLDTQPYNLNTEL